MDDKTKNIKELLSLNGGVNSFHDSAITIIDAIKHLVPNFDQNKFTIEDLNDIIQNIEDQIIPIYDKHFTNEELVGFIEFFKTDVGRVYLNKMGIVALETMQIGNKYGELVYNKLVEIAGKHTEDQSPK